MFAILKIKTFPQGSKAADVLAVCKTFHGAQDYIERYITNIPGAWEWLSHDTMIDDDIFESEITLLRIVEVDYINK